MLKTLKEGLRISRGNIVSFVGAGGKTSLIVKLVEEMKQEKVIIVTTTHFFGFHQFENTEVVASEGSDLVQRINNIWCNNSLRKVVIGKERNYNIKEEEPEIDYKISGIEVERIKELSRAFPEAIILVEADGAKRKQIKAPADHEPVVTRETDIVVPLVGMFALGKKISDKYCHRVEKILNLIPSGDVITEELIVKILTSRESYGMFKDNNKRLYIPVLNQVNYNNMKYALHIAHRLCERGIERVLITDTWSDKPLLAIVEDCV